MSLGEEYSPPGAQITRDLLQGCIRAGHRLPTDAPAGSRGATMGIDVGRFFHIRISDRTREGGRRALFIGKIIDAGDLLPLARKFRVRSMVIDEMPETRKAKEIVAAFRRRGIKAWRIGGTTTQSASSEDSGLSPEIDEEENRVKYGRTLLLDDAMKDILERMNILPVDAASLDGGDYFVEMMQNSRVLVETKRGAIYRWTDERPNDHRFADAYDKLAGHPLLAGRSLFYGGEGIITGGPLAAAGTEEFYDPGEL